MVPTGQRQARVAVMYRSWLLPVRLGPQAPRGGWFSLQHRCSGRPLPPRPGRAGGYRALVIGNDAYEGESSLGSCVNDARAVKEWLLSVGYQEAEIEFLTDARRANMSAALARLVERSRAASPDQVVLYYSGHGAHRSPTTAARGTARTATSRRWSGSTRTRPGTS